MSKKIEAFLDSKCDIAGWTKKTWREWFADVLVTLVQDVEEFCGKRPNCDSDWVWELAAGLARVDPKVVVWWEEPDEGCQWPGDVNWERFTKTAKLVIRHMCGLSKRRRSG